MKRLAFVALLVAALASPVMAGQVQVGYGPTGNYGPWQTGVGGEFTINVYTSGLSTAAYAAGAKGFGGVDSFQTFCIEGNEYIYPFPAITTRHSGTFAVKGGMSGQDPVGSTQDPVSVGTGWLYSQFAQGTLAGYNYSGGTDNSAPYDSPSRNYSADMLQRALWWLEGEQGLVYDGNNTYMAAVVAKFGADAGCATLACAEAAAMANGGEKFGVYALNIWTVDTAGGIVGGQTQLFYVPDGGMTLMLLGGALMGIGALRRKFRI